VISSNTFPSWSWASVKADRPPHNPGTLRPRVHAAADVWQKYKDIHVRIRRGSEQDIDIPTLVRCRESHEKFWPWFDITTWTKEYTVQCDDGDTKFLDIYDEIVLIQDPLVSTGTQIQAVCLEVSGFNVRTDMVRISGLLVVETSEGSYRRVNVFSSNIDAAHFELSAETKLELEHALRAQHDKPKNRQGMQASNLEGWFGPPVLEKLPREQWMKRTLRLI
jgi:hypothetical protein